MEYVIGCFLALLLWAGVDLFVAWVFWNLWNWIMPYLFHLPVIDYWMAFGIIVLLSIIGGFFRSSTSNK